MKTEISFGVSSHDFSATALSDTPFDAWRKFAQVYQITFSLSCRRSLLASPEIMLSLEKVD
jgi:hypothetical protein